MQLRVPLGCTPRLSHLLQLLVVWRQHRGWSPPLDHQLGICLRGHVAQPPDCKLHPCAAGRFDPVAIVQGTNDAGIPSAKTASDALCMSNL